MASDKYNIIIGNITAEENVSVTGNMAVAGTISTKNLNIDGNLILNSVPGLEGQFIKKGPTGTQIWSNIDFSDFAPGNSNQVLVTNPTGSAVVWSDNLNVSSVKTNNINIVNDLQLNSNAGTANQLVRKAPVGLQWFNFALTDIPIGSANQVLATNSAGTVVEWANPQGGISPGLANQILTTNGTGTSTLWNSTINPQTVFLSTLNINGNLRLNNISGVAGNYIRKTDSTTRAWSPIVATDITGGTTNNILVTNTTGNGTIWSNTIRPTTMTTGTLNVTGNLQFNSISGSTGQYARKTAANLPRWATPVIEPGNIIPSATRYHIASTNTSGVAEWTDAPTLQFISFDSGLTPLNYYRDETFSTQWNFTSTGTNAGVTTGWIVRAGRIVTVQFEQLNITVSRPSTYTLTSVTPIASQFRPLGQLVTKIYTDSTSGNISQTVLVVNTNGTFNIGLSPTFNISSSTDIITGFSYSWTSVVSIS